MAIVKLRVFVYTNRVGSKIEHDIEVDIPDNCTPEQKEDLMEEATRNWMFEQIDYGFKVID